MVTLVLKTTSHFAAWLIWKTTRVSVLDDLDVPLPRSEQAD
jgi:hypothetical protein